MKISPEAKARVEAVRDRENYRQALWGEQERRRIKMTATYENPRFEELVEYHVERTRRSYKMIIESYLEGYRMDGTLIDDEDRQQIMKEIQTLIDRRYHDITTRMGDPDFRHPQTNAKIPNWDAALKGQLNRLVGEAVLDLDVARTDLVIEQKKKSTESGTSYHFHARDVYGGAQVGPNNTQNIIGLQYRNGRPHIRWSQLKPEVGRQRVPEVGDVEVQEDHILQAAEIGGNPWVELYEANTFGPPVRKYILGLFTPA